jgi:hypothetical protein
LFAPLGISQKRGGFAHVPPLDHDMMSLRQSAGLPSMFPELRLMLVAVALDAAFFHTFPPVVDIGFPLVAASKQPPNKSVEATGGAF